MQSRIADIRAAGGEVYGIVTDPVETNRDLVLATGLDYTLLSDPELAAIDAFGLRHADGGLDGDIARPAVYVLDREGVVAWRDLTDNWRVRVRPEQVLEVLARLP